MLASFPKLKVSSRGLISLVIPKMVQLVQERTKETLPKLNHPTKAALSTGDLDNSSIHDLPWNYLTIMKGIFKSIQCCPTSVLIALNGQMTTDFNGSRVRQMLSAFENPTL